MSGWTKQFTITCDNGDCTAESFVTTTTTVGPDEAAAEEQMLDMLRKAGWSHGARDLCPACVAKRTTLREAQQPPGRVTVTDHPAADPPVEGHPPGEDHPTDTTPGEGVPPVEGVNIGGPPSTPLANHAEPPQH